MLDETESEYLSFKNPTNNITSTYQSHVVYTNRNVYNINCGNKAHQTPRKPAQLSKQKHLVAFKSKDFQQSSLKSPRSKCQLISFSTDSTKKNQIQQNSHGKHTPSPNEFNTHQISNQQLNKGRLTKAKSTIQFLKSSEIPISQESTSKKLMQEVMGETSQNYQKDFKAHKDRLSYDNYTSLVETLRHYEEKIQRLQKEIMIKNAKIKSLQNVEKGKLNCEIYDDQYEIDSFLRPQNRYVNEENKQNVRRLLIMLQQTDEYKEFAKFALDDNGITLLTEVTKNRKTKLDVQSPQSSKKSGKIHFCSCNKEFIPEQYLWVPESIYQHGKQFLKSHQDGCGNLKGFMSKSEYELLLYELNRMWREREKRVVNTITHEKNLEIEKLKRKYNVQQGERLNSGKKSNF